MLLEGFWLRAACFVCGFALGGYFTSWWFSRCVDQIAALKIQAECERDAAHLFIKRVLADRPIYVQTPYGTRAPCPHEYRGANVPCVECFPDGEPVPAGWENVARH